MKYNVALYKLYIDTSLYMMYILFYEFIKEKPIQIYIEPRQDNILEVISKNRGVSKAAIIRESLEKFLKELPVEKRSCTKDYWTRKFR